jgi:predicted RNase H-like nuclease
VAPSYRAFFDLAEGCPVDWRKNPGPGEAPDAGRLLSAASALLGGVLVDVVAIDMPLATVEITGRREADRVVSKCFGAMWCAVHSPTMERPGTLGRRLTEEFRSHGYPVATTGSERRGRRQILEVYPHAAIIRLLKLSRRLEYKIARCLRYWPGMPVRERTVNLLKALARLQEGLASEIRGIDIRLPEEVDVRSLSSLKRYEDALDALVCASVGISYLRGQCKPYGDDTAAIWIPT